MPTTTEATIDTLVPESKASFRETIRACVVNQSKLCGRYEVAQVITEIALHAHMTWTNIKVNLSSQPQAHLLIGSS